jgi:outer membrane protein OmpA-like peptidoglycan-associated protein
MMRAPLIIFPIILFATLSLINCASSDLSRNMAANTNYGIANAQNAVQDLNPLDLANRYPQANQTTKGAVIGGTAGAVTSLFSSGIGFFPATATGAILGASFGRYIDSVSTARDSLANIGVNVVTLGDNVLIVIPSNRLFGSMSAVLTRNGLNTLDSVARFIRHQRKILVKIAAYTNDDGSSRRELTLSNEQAQAVGRQLQRVGIGARLLYASGYGSSHLVVNTALDWANSDNYRIEITLEKLPSD